MKRFKEFWETLQKNPKKDDGGLKINFETTFSPTSTTIIQFDSTTTHIKNNFSHSTKFSSEILYDQFAVHKKKSKNSLSCYKNNRYIKTNIKYYVISFLLLLLFSLVGNVTRTNIAQYILSTDKFIRFLKKKSIVARVFSRIPSTIFERRKFKL